MRIPSKIPTGLDGMGSASYIDDTVLIDADVNSGWVNAADSTKEVRRYYLHNWRHDVVALLTDGGKLIQNMKYLAYGKAFGLPAGDRDGSGTWTSVDSTAISGYGGSYRVDYDTELDGDIDADDITHANSITSGYYDLGLDRLSTKEVFNRKGYAGYEHAWELEGTKYHVRNRVLDSELGRWTRRDPLGYVDGMGLYEYVSSYAAAATDPIGLAFLPCTSNLCGDDETGPPQGPIGTLICTLNCAICFEAAIKAGIKCAKKGMSLVQLAKCLWSLRKLGQKLPDECKKCWECLGSPEPTPPPSPPQEFDTCEGGLLEWKKLCDRLCGLYPAQSCKTVAVDAAVYCADGKITPQQMLCRMCGTLREMGCRVPLYCEGPSLINCRRQEGQ